MAQESFPLACLPLDLISIILYALSLDDVANLRTAVTLDPCYRNVVHECKRRLSVTLFLERHLGYGNDVLTSMSKNSVILSGSRPLEFFVGNKTYSKDTAWEFYVNDCMSRATSFMYAMERLGVVWESPLDELRSLLRSGTGVMTLSFTSFINLISCGLWDLIESFNHIVERKDTHTNRYWRKLQVSQGKVSVEVPTRGCSLVCSIRGSTTQHSVIRLNITNRGNALDTELLFRYRNSYEQCMITAHTAHHMYGKMASKGLNYQWKRGEEGSTSLLDRSFKTMAGQQCARGFSVRTADDEQSSFIPTFNEVKAPDDVARYYDYMMRTLTWYETVDFVEHINRPLWMVYDNLDKNAKFWLDCGSPHCHKVLEAWK